MKWSDFVERAGSYCMRALYEHRAPWQLPWDPDKVPGLPYNLAHRSRYFGINGMLLSMDLCLRDAKQDGRYLTQHQARQRGAQVREGERGIQICVFETASKNQIGPDGENQEDQKLWLTCRVQTVFHASQIDGLPNFVPSAQRWDPMEITQKVIKASEAEIVHNQSNRAFYDHTGDTIHLPSKESFRSPEYYYVTVLHELAHWTDNQERVARATDTSLALEELQAHFASYQMGVRIRIGYDNNHHPNYAETWTQTIADSKPQDIVKAYVKGERIVRYLLWPARGYLPKAVL